MLRRIAAFALCGATSLAAWGQPVPRVWEEAEAPPPPALRTSGLIPLEVPGTSLRFGIDPASVSVGKDRVVRYVVVATSSSGTVNAIYEAIRCDEAKVKVYARHNPDSGWVPSRSPDWQDLHTAPNSRHSLFIARNGVCLGHGANGSAAQIVQDLQAPVERRFRGGGVNR